MICQCVDRVCMFCSRPLPEKAPDNAARRCIGKCRHLGIELGTALIPCPTCRGNVRQKFPLHACAKHGPALPTYRGQPQEGYAICANCPDFNPVPPAP